MSRPFRDKNKDLVNLEIVPSEKVWVKKNNKYILDKNLPIYGKIDKNMPNMILTTNQKGENHKFVEDTSKMTKITKNKIINFFFNNKEKRKVAYLIKSNNKTKN